MSPTYTGFCRDLAGRGFDVWMPHLGGRCPSISNADPSAPRSGSASPARSTSCGAAGRAGWSRPCATSLAPVRPARRWSRRCRGHVPDGWVRPCHGRRTERIRRGRRAAGSAAPARLRAFARPVPRRRDAIGERLADREVAILYTRFERDALSPPQTVRGRAGPGPGRRRRSTRSPRPGSRSVITRC